MHDTRKIGCDKQNIYSCKILAHLLHVLRMCKGLANNIVKCAKNVQKCEKILQRGKRNSYGCLLEMLSKCARHMLGMCK